MSNTQHAPLPWELADNGLIYGQTQANDDEAPIVADTIADRDRMAFGISTDTERANAEFIVRACNAHDLLRTSCIELLFMLTEWKRLPKAYDKQAAFNRARAALVLSKEDG